MEACPPLSKILNFNFRQKLYIFIWFVLQTTLHLQSSLTSKYQNYGNWTIKSDREFKHYLKSN